MRLTAAFLAGISLAGVLPAQAAGRERATLLLLVQGTIDRVDVISAWPRTFPFHAPHDVAAPTGWIRLYDAAGHELSQVHLDLSTVNLHRGAAKGQTIVRGDTLLEGSISLLVKIPDFGRELARLDFEIVEADGRRAIGSTSGDILRRIVDTTQSVRPLMAPTVRTHLNNGPSNNRYDIVVLGDGYQSSEEALFVADVDKWIANLFAKQPFATYKQFFNVHSVFRASVESGADKPSPCTNPPVSRNTVYDASYCTGGTDRCLYIKNTTLAAQDAALAPDVEGRIAVFVNDSKYGGCASTFAVSYNGSSGPEVQSHEFGHSYGGVADEYDYGQSGCYTGPEPSAANITKDPQAAKWSLWKGYNGVGAFEGAGYYPKCLYRPKVNCLMRALGVVLCEVCVEELTLDGYTTVNPIESPVPAALTLNLVKPTPQSFSFMSLVPGGGTVKWYVDNVLQQTGGASYLLQTSGLTAGPHSLRLELFDNTAFVRKDPSNKRTRSRTWSLTLWDGGTYTTYGTGCSGSGPRVPALGNTGVPEIGRTFQITLGNARASTAAAVWLGIAQIAVPLPPSLAPGCSLYASPEVFPLAATATSGTGYAAVTVGIPNLPVLRGVTFYNQWYVYDPGANSLNVLFSNGGAGRIGG